MQALECKKVIFLTKKQHMRPLIVTLIALFYLSFNISKKDRLVDGYVILKSGDRKEVRFILLGKSPLVIEKSDYDFSESRMTYAKYIDANGKKERVKPKDLKEYGFTYAGREFVYRNVKVPVPANMPFFDLSGEGFYQVAIDGKCKLLFYYEEAKTVIGGMPIIVTNYLLLNPDLKTFKVRNVIGGKLIMNRENNMTIEEFFSDCETLVSKLKNKEFKEDKYIESVNFYNQSCGK
jgi:hypothetical protein